MNGTAKMNMSITSTLEDEYFSVRVQIEGFIDVSKGAKSAPANNVIEFSIVYNTND
jgi:hypothetical protein